MLSLLLFQWKGWSLSSTLRGVVLVSDLADADGIDPSQVDGLYVDDQVLFPGTVEELKKQIAGFYSSEAPLDRTLLLSVKNQIVRYFNQHQQQSVYVSIPEQEVTSGVVVFEVKQAKIGKVVYKGNRWFPQARVEKALALKSGEVIDVNDLLNRVSFLNFNPFHHTEVILSPGISPGKTDVEALTVDRFPLRTFVGGDNTGTEATGTGRYFVGLTWGNAFFIDDLWTYQFSMNNHFTQYSSHTMSYLSFLPSKHMINLFGGYSLIHPQIEDFRSHGKDAQLSFRYKIPFKPLYTPLQHNVYFGFDYKYFTSALFFVDELRLADPVVNGQVNVSQAVLGYQLDYNAAPHQVFFRVECVGSPMQWLPHQTKQAYARIRPDSDPRYFYFTTALGEVYTFPSKYAIAATLRTQGSANTLIPSEQFQLGGYNTVRGYDQSVFIGDNAICLNFELRSRPFSFSKKLHDALTFLGFLDYGWGYNYHPFDGITTSATLLGVGPGFRYRIDPYVEVRFDYGFKLNSVNFDDNKLGMFHVGVNVGY